MAFRLEIKEIEKQIRDRSIRGNRQQRVFEAEMRIKDIREKSRQHPCFQCPDREAHARLCERADRLVRENTTLKSRLETRTLVIPRIFDRVTSVLQELQYIDGETLSDKGELLSKIYTERDLLLSQTLTQQVLENLTAADLVAVLSVFVFDNRGEAKIAPKIPRTITTQLEDIVRIWSDLTLIEERHGVIPQKEPAFDFVWQSQRWANGHSLASILRDSDLSVGDFVRSIRQIIDLLGQLNEAQPSLTPTIRDALKRIDRGIITYSGALL
jgi:ATP-dependent RNA helicase HelY